MFGALSLVSPGAEIEIGGARLTLPRPAGLLLERLVTDRTGEKGERDLLVALGLLAISTPEDLDELEGPLAAPAAIPREEAERLVAEGHAPDPVGGELEPPKIIVLVPTACVARIGSARPLAVRLSAELLSAESLAVVPFPA